MAEQSSKEIAFKEFKFGVGASPIKVNVAKENYQMALGKSYFPL